VRPEKSPGESLMRMKKDFDEALSYETIEPSEHHRFGATVSFG
jgi:hypothetical protein